MNIKLHTPKTLQTGSGMSSAKQFLLSLLATSVSIILTFGTAAIIDYNKKQAAKKEMVMMIISDMDNSIELVEKIDTGLHECRRLQNEIAIHPEQFDSKRVNLAAGMSMIFNEFPETTERIFTSSIETFNTIGDVNFVNEVSSFYMSRNNYKKMMKRQRDMCMQMMKVSEKDLAEFGKQHTKTDNQEEDTVADKVNDEFMSYSTVLEQAKEKLKK